MNFEPLAQKIAEEFSDAQKQANYMSTADLVNKCALKVLNSLELPMLPATFRVNRGEYEKGWANGYNDCLHEWTKALEGGLDVEVIDKTLKANKAGVEKLAKIISEMSEEDIERIFKKPEPQTKGQDMKWCEHIERFNDGEKDKWHLKTLVIKDEFKFCPICAAPRPTEQSEKPKLPDELTVLDLTEMRGTINAIIRHLRAKE